MNNSPQTQMEYLIELTIKDGNFYSEELLDAGITNSMAYALNGCADSGADEDGNKYYTQADLKWAHKQAIEERAE